MVEMIKLEDGAYVPKECCGFTNPLTSGGKSEIDDIDIPCGADCGEECGSCVIQKIFNEYARVTGQEHKGTDESKTRNITYGNGFTIDASDSKNFTVNIQDCRNFTVNIQDCKNYSINKQDCKDIIVKSGEQRKEKGMEESE